MLNLKFENGNKVTISYFKRKEFTAILNDTDFTHVNADNLALLLNDLRKITCVINSWSAIK